MKKILNKKYIILYVLIILLTINFRTNFLSNDNISEYSFDNFQYDSEKLVLEKIAYDNNKYIPGTCKYGLCKLEKNYKGHTLYFVDYESQVGLQGYIISFLHNKLNISIETIYIILCFLLSLILTTISYLIFKKYNKSLGVIFYITFFLSPWIIAFARNLYWVTFTWFAPMMLGLILAKNYKKIKIITPLIFIAILIKCLCGYEYITTIMLSTIMFFIIDLFVGKNKKEKIKIIKTIFVVGVTCLLAFATSLLIHGYMRGEGDIVKGVNIIYKNDVLRRTIITTAKDNYDGIIRESIDANIFDVLKLYYFNWRTDIIYGISSIWFFGITITSFIIAIFNMVTKKKNNKQNIVLYIMCLLTTISWFILGKSHSYIHVHMNFVLWYFGYVQVCIYLLYEFIKDNVIKLNEKKCKNMLT